MDVDGWRPAVAYTLHSTLRIDDVYPTGILSFATGAGSSQQQWLTRFRGDGMSGLTFDSVPSCTISPNEKAGESWGDPLDLAGGGGVGCCRAYCFSASDELRQ